MTSLPPDSAIFNVRVSVFQRSAGRSAVAAAAYRSASRLEDRRIGQVFDYTKKSAEESFIIAPPDAPEWVYDREELWNRVEQAERRKDVVVAREILITIPRDIPESDRRAFAKAAVAPYVAAGAVVDVAIHCPRAVDGDEQPHIHGMIAPRALDASQETGFAKVRNAALTSMFESGGRHGGERGAALAAERERIATLMNNFLIRAGSTRRADHRSNTARGLHDRNPEPKIGEGRLRAVKKRKRHDRLTAAVGGQRAARKAENELTKLEEELMAMNPKYQSVKGIRPRHRQDFKVKLLADRFPDADLSGFSQQLYQVDTRSPSKTVVRMRDHGWLEIAGRRIKTYGPKGQANDLARRLADAGYADDIETLPETASFQRKDSGLRQRRKHEQGKTLPSQPLSVVEQRAEWWMAQGFTDASAQPDGVWISIGSCRLQDLGDELRIHGRPTDDATRSMVLKAVEQWGSEMEVFGSRDFKDSIWIECQRQGVKLYDADTGKEYKPSASIVQDWEDSAERLQRQQEEFEELHAARKLSGLLKSAAAGDAESAARLRNHDPELFAFVSLHLDEDQRRELAQEPDEKMIPALTGFRDFGRKALEDENQKPEEARTPDRAQHAASVFGLRVGSKRQQAVDQVTLAGIPAGQRSTRKGAFQQPFGLNAAPAKHQEGRGRDTLLGAVIEHRRR